MRRRAAATVFGCASVLLDYPDERNLADLRSVRGALEGVPDKNARSGLAVAVEWLEHMSPIEAQAIYVETFDLRKGVCLHLTHYRHGDTRERGMALTALVDAFRGAGFGVASGELPDYLPALLELAAVHPVGATVLAEHRMALDALRAALSRTDARYAGVVDAMLCALPGPTARDRQALRRYRSEGPPSEKVGLEPFAPPEVLGQAGATAEARR